MRVSLEREQWHNTLMGFEWWTLGCTVAQGRIADSGWPALEKRTEAAADRQKGEKDSK